MEPIKVLLVDNEEVFREGLAKMLNDQPQISVVYQCRDAKEVAEMSQEMTPSVILVDSQISGGKALEAITEISRSLPEAKVVVMTHPESPANVIEIFKAGAKACFARTISILDLVKSIELVSSGRIIISPIVVKQFLDEIASVKKEEVTRETKTESLLSEREIEVAKLISQGATNNEIAGKLFISESTVKVHVKHILHKLELRNRQQLAVYAVLKNWFSASTNAEGTKDMSV